MFLLTANVIVPPKDKTYVCKNWDKLRPKPFDP